MDQMKRNRRSLCPIERGHKWPPIPSPKRFVMTLQPSPTSNTPSPHPPVNPETPPQCPPSKTGSRKYARRTPRAETWRERCGACWSGGGRCRSGQRFTVSTAQYEPSEASMGQAYGVSSEDMAGQEQGRGSARGKRCGRHFGRKTGVPNQRNVGRVVVQERRIRTVLGSPMQRHDSTTTSASPEDIARSPSPQGSNEDRGHTRSSAVGGRSTVIFVTWRPLHPSNVTDAETPGTCPSHTTNTPQSVSAPQSSNPSLTHLPPFLAHSIRLGPHPPPPADIRHPPHNLPRRNIPHPRVHLVPLGVSAQGADGVCPADKGDGD